VCVEKETAAELARTMRGEEAATEAGEDEGGCGSSLHSTDSHQVTPLLLHQKIQILRIGNTDISSVCHEPSLKPDCFHSSL
jgi:hypothetical protein